jgi:hypothetical protein
MIIFAAKFKKNLNEIKKISILFNFFEKKIIKIINIF